jgi:hypothetical protein
MAYLLQPEISNDFNTGLSMPISSSFSKPDRLTSVNCTSARFTDFNVGHSLISKKCTEI